MTMALALAAFIGTYSGEGTWYDSSSDSKDYRVEMKIETLQDSKVRLWFKHLFYQENDSVIEQTIEFVPERNGFSSISLVGTPVTGSAYCAKDACHYSIPLPGNLVEVTYFFSESGVIRIVGSAEKNVHGHRIWWEEQVQLEK